MNNSPLLLPGHPLFLPTLQSTLPPGWQNISTNTPIFVADANNGMLRQITENQIDDYVFGGEYEEVEGAETIDFNL
jgi:hypothetical protein